MRQLINDYIATLIKTLNLLDVEAIEIVANHLIKARDSGKHIYVFGNGGSGATASHMVCDILKGCSYEKTSKFKISCLNDNIPTLLAYSNDVGYDVIFEEQLKNYLTDGDVVLGISGSGNSKNVLNAIAYANGKNALTIGFTGLSGGKLIDMAKVSFHIPINDMQITEDIHFITNHILYKIFDAAL